MPRRVASRQLSRRRKRARTSTQVSVKSARRVNIGRDVHYFKRFMAAGSYTGNALYAPLLQGWSCTFNGLRGASEFTNLFDQYKISHVQVRFYLKIDPGAQSAAGASYPKLYYCQDHDDDSAPPSLDALREHSKTKVRVMNPNRAVVINIKPAVLTMVYRTVSTTGYAPKWRQWIDCNQTDVPHYGFKWAIDDLTNTNYKVDIETIAWFACRAAR